MLARTSSTLSSAGGLSFANVDIPKDIDLRRPVDPETKPKYRIFEASDTLLLAMRPEGIPERKVWDANGPGSSAGLFRVKAVTLPSLANKDKNDTEYRKDYVFEHLKSQLARPPTDSGSLQEEAIKKRDKRLSQISILSSMSGLKMGATATANMSSSAPSLSASSPTHSKKSGGGEGRKRSQKYFDLLMKNHNDRVYTWDHEDEADKRLKAETDARFYTKKVAFDLERKREMEREEVESRSSSELEQLAKKPRPTSPEKPEDCKMMAWDGMMQVDVEVVILNPPGYVEPEPDWDDESSESSSSAGFSDRRMDTHERHESKPPKRSSQSSSSEDMEGLESLLKKTGRGATRSLSSGSHSKSQGSGSSDAEDAEPALDLYNELEMLKEEVGVEEKAQSEASDDIPENLKLKRLQNVWDNPKPSWSLGIGGTVFFLPDAERYAMGSSLPPPPPPSLQGRRRLHLKPRLPLEISNHRYRDEHPNIWPDAPFCPAVQDYLRFEETMMTLDLYKSCNVALSQLPQMERAAHEAPHRRRFGHLVERETHKSVAWRNWRHREKLIRKDEAQKAQREQEAAAIRAAQAAKAAAEEAEQKKLDELEDM
eukprot:CAMPEP_0206592808 /NCGR_PEP_ID=MMETSP0325_2-20121206/41212_1 /ASSEMBLY_ACC=CAM_ASM_000347 /TAXON_ID=2866 /ORGANISM="Crypthecodinium cohnii, Strain Seligo" /LENGTH=597 /DNA_ID=CAMNT_0054102575 /DNA_START=67 /DNA_END=1860 /DNA_ORIENTATION=+